MGNPPSQVSQISQVAKSARKKRGRSERKRLFSNTMAVIREDPHDVSARLTMVELLQEDERVEDSVGELMRVASVYTRRGVPIKAVAVLRQAVRLQPERPDVRMAYGEVFTKLRMVEDAAREYRHAYELYKQAGNLSAMLDALSGVTRLDPGNLHANLRLAESLSRAGRNEQAAVVFSELASHLLEKGATSDWEKIAERAVFHAPDNITLAHDLALHYVRAGRYGAALSKLIICYEREPNDVELLELIVDTLEYLGVRDRAASLMRRLVGRYQRSGLVAEAEAALERLYSLDPDDAEAQEAMGALMPAVAPETVIELEQDIDLPKLVEVDEDAEIGFGGDFIDELLSEDAAPAEDDYDDVPMLGDDAFDEAPALPDAAFEEEDGPATQQLDVSAVLASTRPRRTPSRSTLEASSRRGRLNNARLSGTRRRVQLQDDDDDSTQALVPVPSRRAPRLPFKRTGEQVSVAGRRGPSRTVSSPSTSRGRRPAISSAAPVVAPTRQRPSAPVVAARPPTANEMHAASFGFDSLHDQAPIDSEFSIGFEPNAEATVIDEGLLDQLKALDHGEAPQPARAPLAPSRTTLTAKRRGNSLPRPRLTRARYTAHDLPAQARGVNNDLKTLDFFIERGFYESAVALVDELAKRHPNSEELRLRRQRIAKMKR